MAECNTIQLHYNYNFFQNSTVGFQIEYQTHDVGWLSGKNEDSWLSAAG